MAKIVTVVIVEVKLGAMYPRNTLEEVVALPYVVLSLATVEANFPVVKASRLLAKVGRSVHKGGVSLKKTLNTATDGTFSQLSGAGQALFYAAKRLGLPGDMLSTMGLWGDPAEQ